MSQLSACPVKRLGLQVASTCNGSKLPSATRATGLYRFYLQLITDFWGRILVGRQGGWPRLIHMADLCGGWRTNKP